MPLDTLLTFIATTMFISATPGPNMLLMLSHGARFGWRATLATMAGALSGLALLIGLSALGLAAVLAASTTLFTILKLAGAAYLLYLGWQCWQAGVELNLPTAFGETGLARYRTGLAVALSNPKAILFASAFLPQFIQPALPQGQQWAVLLVTFFLIESGWQLAYAVGGVSLARWLSAPRRVRFFNRSCGIAFWAVGGMLALARR
ncbi:LysE family translocator [Chitinilyticum piscinae]|uniref:LysE family translocator n=1 Tax=Chitinilyticum piscinae TaxID=2866724 RepID=A0A8J7FJS7_9NEIS|nr:LysE family translocator [Chitinilyticum piscinae]MBE9610458.1 LysE family translocator [Chitinilyticum piscinae]